MTARLFFLISALAFALAARAASTISFKDITSTNVVKTNDLFLLDSDLGGGNYATRTAPIALLPSGGDTIWTNSAGVITTGATNSYGNFLIQLNPDGTLSANTATTWDGKLSGEADAFSYVANFNGTNIAGINPAAISISIYGTGNTITDQAWTAGIYGVNGISRATSLSPLDFNTLGNNPSASDFGILGQFQGGGSLYGVGVFGDTSANITNAFGVVGVSGFGNTLAVGLTGSAWKAGNAVGVYSEVVTGPGAFYQVPSAAAQNSWEDAVFLGDNRDSGVDLLNLRSNGVSVIKVYPNGSFSTGGNPDRWIFKGLTVDGGGATNVNYSVNGTNLTMGNVTSTGASVAGQLLGLTGTDGKSVVPTNAIPSATTIDGQTLTTVLTNKAPIASPTFTGTAVAPSLQVSSLLVGSMSIGTRSVLTETGGNLVLDMSLTNRYWSCSATGNVQVLLTNCTAGNWGNVLIRWPATNCQFTLLSVPAGSTTNWISGAPSTNAFANTIGFLGVYPIDSTTNSTILGYSATQ